MKTTLMGIVGATLIGATSLQADFKAIEVTPTHDEDVRVRAIVSLEKPITDNATLQYHAVHEITNFDLNTYFGVSNIGFGDEHIRVGARIQSDNTGLEIMPSVRNESLIKKFADYGYAEVATDGNKCIFRCLAGFNLPNNYGVEVFTAQIFGEGKPFNWTEIQGYKHLTDDLSLTLRAEIPNGDIDKTTFLGGLVYKF